MTPEAFVEIFQEALYIVLLLVCAIVIPGLVIGLVVAVFQAATSINEQTLSFLPRLVITLLALIVMSHWMVQVLMEYFYRIVLGIPSVLY